MEAGEFVLALNAPDRWDCFKAIGLCVTAARRERALLGRVDELRRTAGDRLEPGVARLVDARDRLERQVAAQTEELRVQRAAITRTQRAVRNLGRGEESEEQEATEPAIRDPRPPSDR